MQNGAPTLWIHGLSGRMGHELYLAALAASPELGFVGGSGQDFAGRSYPPQGSGHDLDSNTLRQALDQTRPTLVVDFSSPEGSMLLCQALLAGATHYPAVLIGTTGMNASQLDAWRAYARDCASKVLVAPNTSIGVLLLAQVARIAAQIASPLGFDVEIVETHHRHKKDAPSGTARFVADAIQREVPHLRQQGQRSGARKTDEIGMHAVRGGGVFGEHQVRLISQDEELTLEHRAFSRALFASGAMTLLRWLNNCQQSGYHHLLDIKPEELIALQRRGGTREQS